jgi:hypothetical protein
MGIFSKIKGIFRRKKEEPLPELEKLKLPKPEITTETATIENVKAKMDLVLTQLDSLRTQYEAMNERVITIEKMLKELYTMAKS